MIFDPAIFDPAIFDTGETVVVQPRVVLANDTYKDERSTERNPWGRGYYQPGQLSGRYQ